MNKVFDFISNFFDKRIYVFVALFIALIGFDLIAIKYSLYFHFRWVDIPVHFLGGFFLGALFFYIVFSNPRTKKILRLPRTNKNIFFVSVLLVFCAAVVWEVLEFWAGRSVWSGAYVPDTTLDLIAGTLGGYLFYLFYKTIREMIKEDYRE